MTFKVKVRARDLYGFTIYHTYSGMMGKLWVLFSIVCLAAAIWTFGDISVQGTVALVVMGCLFTVLNPLMLYYKCIRRVQKTAIYKEPFQYTLTKKGFSIAQGDQSSQMRWLDLFQIICTKKAVYLCPDPIHAQIISLEQLGDQAEQLKDFLRKQVSQDVRKKGL